jgi:hypothetical protein
MSPTVFQQDEEKAPSPTVFQQDEEKAPYDESDQRHAQH